MKKSRPLVVVAAGFLVAALGASISEAAPTSFQVKLSGAQQVPPVQSSGTGSASLTYNPDTKVVTWSITYSGLSGPVTMAHFHGPAKDGANGPVVIWLTKKGSPVESPISGQATLTPAQAQEFTSGELYINLHTADHPTGELRGQVMPTKG